MGFLIAAFIVLFLILLLSMPLIVDARARIGLRGAVVRARVYLFGLIPIPVKLRLHLFSKPYFTLRFGKKRIPLFKRKKKRTRKRRPVRGVRILRLDTRTTVGIREEPAKAVLCAGTVAVLFSMLTTRVAESGSARAAIGEPSMIRISAWVRTIVYPHKLLFGFVSGSRIAPRKSANNTRKTNEKRTKHASC